MALMRNTFKHIFKLRPTTLRETGLHLLCLIWDFLKLLEHTTMETPLYDWLISVYADLEQNAS